MVHGERRVETLTTVKVAATTIRTRLRVWNPPAPPMADFAVQTTMHHFRAGHLETSVLNLV